MIFPPYLSSLFPSLSPPGQLLAQASDSGVIHLLDLKSGQIHKLMGHEDEVHAVAFSQDAESLFSGGSEGTVRMWSWWPLYPTAQGTPLRLEHASYSPKPVTTWLSMPAGNIYHLLLNILWTCILMLILLPIKKKLSAHLFVPGCFFLF